MRPAGDQDAVELVPPHPHYRPKHVELIETVNKIIIVASSRLFILLYQRCTVTQTTNNLSTSKYC